MNSSRRTWWRGSRGEWYLMVQAGLFLLLILGPRECSGLPVWNSAWSQVGSVAAAILLVPGVLLAAVGALYLGRNLTPLPKPRSGGELVQNGPYRFVRHPIYSGLIFISLAWGLWLHSWLTVGYAVLIFIFFDIKSRREERWLEEKFPQYGQYRKHTRKLIPFIY